MAFHRSGLESDHGVVSRRTDSTHRGGYSASVAMVSVCELPDGRGEGRWVSAVVAAGAADAVLPESLRVRNCRRPNGQKRGEAEANVPRDGLAGNGDVVRTISLPQRLMLYSMDGALPGRSARPRGAGGFQVSRLGNTAGGELVPQRRASLTKTANQVRPVAGQIRLRFFR